MKRIYLILSVCVLIIFGIFIFLFGTNTGMNLMFTGLMNYIPGLTFDTISGAWGDITIINLVYQMPQGVLRIGKLYISIDLKRFLLKQINIKRFILDNVFIDFDKININNNKITSKVRSQVNKFFFTKHSIIMNHVILFNVNIISDEIILQFQKINTGLTFRNDILKILPTCITGGVILNKSFMLDTIVRKNYSIKDVVVFCKRDLLNTQFIHHNLIKIKLIKKSVCNMLMNLSVMNFRVKDLNMCLVDKTYRIVNDLDVHMDCNTERIKIKVKANLPVGYVNGVGKIICKENYPVHMMLQYINQNSINNYRNKCNQDLKALKLIIKGELLNDLYIQLDCPNFVFRLQALLRIKLMYSGIPVNLFIKSEKISFFIGNNRNKFVLEKFDLYFTGNINDYYINIQSKLINPRLSSDYDIFVNVRGDMGTCTISLLKIVGVLNGYCEFRGVVHWDKLISVDGICIFDKMNVLNKILKYPLGLSGKMTIKGYWCIDTWELIISKINLKGIINNNNNIVCLGSVYIKPNGQWYIPMFLINCNNYNVLKVQGGLSKDRFFCLNATINVTDRFVHFSKFHGNIYGSVSLTGFIELPKLSCKLFNCSLYSENKNISVDNIMMNADISYDKSMKSDVFIEAKKIRYKKFVIDKICMELKGCLKQHFFNFIIMDNTLSGVFNIKGEFDYENQVWNGRINKTDIITVTGKWTLIHDIMCTYNHEFRKIILGPHCWKNNVFKISISDTIQKNILSKLNIILKDFNFDEINLNLVDIVSITNACVYFKNFNWVLNKKLPCSTILVSGSACNIKYFNQSDILEIVSDCINTCIIINQFDLFFELVMNVDNHPNFAKFLITNVYDNIPKISGEIKAENISCGEFLKSLCLSKHIIGGSVSVDINFEGDVYCPKVYGLVKLVDFDVCQPNTLFFIKDGALDIEFLGSYARFNGSISIGHDKKVYLNGKIRRFYSIHDMDITVKIQGDQLNLYISPEVCVRISPRIICRVNSKKVDIQGYLEVPWACIKMQEFSTNMMVEIASEEILLDENFKPIQDSVKTGFMIPFVSNIMIHLGDDVSFHGFGLHVKLRGDVRVVYHKEDIILIGHINISSGDFKAYGQNLTIRRGQLLFSGPISQTYLDIEGIRSSSELVNAKKGGVDAIGIRVSGMLDKLKLEFFYSPCLSSQQKKVSYLLGWNNLICADAYDINNMIASLLVGISMDRCTSFINKIGNTLGIQDLTLNTQDFGTLSSSLSLSGYIAPGFQIKYGINMFDSLTTVTIRYRLHSKLYLEATSSGHNQTVDLLYQIDF